jgi:hypothetical protein
MIVLMSFRPDSARRTDADGSGGAIDPFYPAGVCRQRAAFCNRRPRAPPRDVAHAPPFPQASDHHACRPAQPARLRESPRLELRHHRAQQRLWDLEPGETKVLLDTGRPGCVKHICMTFGADPIYARKLAVRMF